MCSATYKAPDLALARRAAARQLSCFAESYPRAFAACRNLTSHISVKQNGEVQLARAVEAPAGPREAPDSSAAAPTPKSLSQTFEELLNRCPQAQSPQVCNAHTQIVLKPTVKNACVGICMNTSAIACM